MKKAKIMLAAIAVLAVVGGTLAFKAQKFTTNRFYYDAPDGFCTSFIDLKSTTQAGAINFPTYSLNSSTEADCDGLRVIPNGEL